MEDEEKINFEFAMKVESTIITIEFQFFTKKDIYNS